MLKIGTNNYISTATISATSSSLGRFPYMMKDSSITSWQGASPNCSVQINLTNAGLADVIVAAGDVMIDIGTAGEVLGTQSFSVDLITAHRISFEGTLTVSAYFAGALVDQKTFNPGQMDGIEVFSLYTGISGLIDSVTFAFSGGVNFPSIGYLWVGSSIDFKSTAYQDSDESSDIASISQGGYAGNSRRPILRKIVATIAHEESGSLKSKLRQLMITGYSTPRPVLRDDDCLPQDTMLAILDSPKIGYDFFDNKDATGRFKSQATIGFSEVFGGIN